MLAVALSFAALQVALGGGPSTAGGTSATKLIERAKKQELDLFVVWRNAWRGLRDLNSSGSRFWSLHCHFDDAGFRDRKHLIHTSHSRKSMCPVWFQNGGTRADESTGIDNPLSDKARQKVRGKRAEVLRLLDSAATLAPTDAWVLGQRIRLYVDQGEFARAAAIAASECRLSRAGCALLEGYALASAGNWEAAATSFDVALQGMSQPERCEYLDIALLVDPDQRERHGKLPCPASDAIATRFWWLADPLFAQPGNERLYIHLYRQTMISLRSVLTMDEHIDWRPESGGVAATEMMMRYGMPSVQYYNPREDDSHNGWLGWPYRTGNSSHEYFMPRYHTTPPYAVASLSRPLERGDVADLAPGWDDEGRKLDERWWPFEHFVRAGPLAAMEMQAAAFRRERAPLLAVAMDPRSRHIGDSTLERYTATVFVARGPEEKPIQSSAPAVMRSTGTLPISVQARPGAHIVSAEVVDLQRDSAPAARARFSLTLPAGLDALGPGELALSESALFAAPPTDDSLPRSLASAMERMLPTTTLRTQRVGVFVEMYGVAQGDPVELTLTVVSEAKAGLLRRLGNRLGITDADGQSFVVRWRDDQPGTASSAVTIGDATVQTRAIVLNFGALTPGRYHLVVGAARPGEPVVISRREFSVVR